MLRQISWCLSFGDERRIIKLFELKGTLKCHVVQPPCNEQGHLQLHQVAQTPFQPYLEHPQGWSIHQLSGQPGPVPHHSYCKKKILISNLNLPSVSLKPLPLTTDPAEESVLFLLIPPFRYCKAALRSSRAFSSPDRTAPALTACPCRRGVHPLDHFCGPPLDTL